MTCESLSLSLCLSCSLLSLALAMSISLSFSLPVHVRVVVVPVLYARISLTGGWLRELTRECVEANPGPTHDDECKCTLSREELRSTDKADGSGKFGILDMCPMPLCGHLIGQHAERQVDQGQVCTHNTDTFIRGCISSLLFLVLSLSLYQ